MSEELFAAVYAAPDDDAPRARLAESLRRAGDPRGDFIAAQLAGDPARELLREHEQRWLGPLAPVLARRGLRWARGFVVAGRLKLGRSDEARRSWIGMPELATLRELDLDPRGSIMHPPDFFEPFVWGSPLRRLRRLVSLPRRLLPRLLTDVQPWGLTTVEIAMTGGGGLAGKHSEQKEIEELRAAFAKATGVPHLEHLVLSFSHSLAKPPNFDWLWTTPTGRRLRTLGMYEPSHALVHWMPALREHDDELSLQRFELRSISTLVLHRDDGGWSRLTGRLDRSMREVAARDLASTLAQLGEAITDVDVAGYG